jgi:type II secretory pathway component GspD/PulD (secretin)
MLPLAILPTIPRMIRACHCLAERGESEDGGIRKCPDQEVDPNAENQDLRAILGEFYGEKMK